MNKIPLPRVQEKHGFWSLSKPKLTLPPLIYQASSRSLFVHFLKRLRRLSPSLKENAVFLYSAQVKGSYREGSLAVTISGGAIIFASSGGPAKKAIDILDLHELLIALCLTLTNLPLVIAYKMKQWVDILLEKWKDFEKCLVNLLLNIFIPAFLKKQKTETNLGGSMIIR